LAKKINPMKMKNKGYSCSIGTRPGVCVTFGLGVKPVWAIVSPVVKLATGATRAAMRKMASTETMTMPKIEALVSIRIYLPSTVERSGSGRLGDALFRSWRIWANPGLR